MLHSGFLASLDRYPMRPAIACDGQVLTYRQLWARASALAGRMARRGRPTTVAVLAPRGVTMYASVLACSVSGATWVPLSPTTLVPRLRETLHLAGAEVLVHDEVSTATARAIADGIDRICDDAVPPGGDAGPAEADVVARTDNPAYLLFTSGTTGRPKGVPIGHRHVDAFVDVLAHRYDFGPDDRFAQLAEPTFDLSMIAMLAAWRSGGCMDVIDVARLALSPRRPVRTAFTVWTSTPSVAGLLLQRAAARATLSGLRVSLFCGEALPSATAVEWQAATGGGRVDNLYGPTEATVAVLGYRLGAPTDGPERDAIVPIGQPFPGVRAVIVDPATGAPAHEGELCIAGRQTFSGYLGGVPPAEQTFLTVEEDGRSVDYYRTGDRVRIAADGCYVFLGRTDDQLKVLGHRLELGEVEAAVRAATGVGQVVAVPWPVRGGVVRGVAAFVVGEVDVAETGRLLRDRLPRVAVPTPIVPVRRIPVTGNGKADRARMASWLDDGVEEKFRVTAPDVRPRPS